MLPTIDGVQVNIMQIGVHEIGDHQVVLDVSFRLSQPARLTFVFEIAGYDLHIQQNEHPASPPMPLRTERSSREWQVKPGDLYITVSIYAEGKPKDTCLKLHRVYSPPSP